MHCWGDDWFQKNGNDLDNAIRYCSKIWRKYGRIGAHPKEKYGTFRDQLVGLWEGRMHELIWPGYYYVKNRLLYYTIDEYITIPFMRYTGLYYLFRWYQKQVYNYTIQKVCKRYPNIIDELVSDLDGYYMVRPGVFGLIDGQKIHDKHWISNVK